MKKILAVVLSLAMILSMSVCAFATDDLSGAVSQAYYEEVLSSNLMDDDAKIAAITTVKPNEDALVAAIVAVREAGVDIEGAVAGLNVALAENYDMDLENALYEDIDGDGYLGDPADGVVYIPEDPTDVEAWTTYYTILLGEAATNPTAVITVVPEIAGNVTSGQIDMDTFTSAFPEAAKAVGGDVVNQIVWGVEDLLSTDLNSDGYVGKPDGNIDDGKLPEEDEGGNAGGGFEIGGLLDTVLGILGTIGELIFGGGNDNPGTTDPSDPGDEDGNLWDEEDPFDNGGDNGSTIPDTGDTTVFAVAAVALAAGAALVMTRKKSEDAE